jgi:hypothetical protein
MTAEKQTPKVFTVFKLPFLSKNFRIKSGYLFKEMGKYLFNLDEFFTKCLCQVCMATEAIDNNRSESRLFLLHK